MRWTPKWYASRRTSANDSGDASGPEAALADQEAPIKPRKLETCRRCPLFAQDAHQQGVAEAVLAFDGPAETALVHEAEPLVGGDGRVVEIEDAQADAVQAQVLEGVAHDHRYGLGPVAMAPVVRSAHDNGQLRREVCLADIHQADDADGLLLPNGVD